MGCGVSKAGGPPTVVSPQLSSANNAHGLARDSSGRLSRTSSRQCSKARLQEFGSGRHGSGRQKPLSRTPSGKEGRLGFVPLREGSFGSKRFAEEESSKNGEKVLSKATSASQRTHEVLHQAAAKAAGLLHKISSEHLRTSPSPSQLVDWDEDGQPDFVLNVVYVFRKALEFKEEAPITQHNLDGTMDKVVAALDPGSTGDISTGSLIAYIQNTCTSYNQHHGNVGRMTVPTVDQILQAFSSLDLSSTESLKTVELKAALLGMDWGLLPAKII